MDNNDLNEFIENVPWFFNEDDKINVAGETNFTSHNDFKSKYPKLTRLLSQARVTIINVNELNEYMLFGWTNKHGESFGWLCLPPHKLDYLRNSELHEDHILLLRSFGGIVERWNEPEESWLCNLKSALTLKDSVEGFDWLEELFTERCKDEGLEPGINSYDYIAFAFEANGNMTLYNKYTSEVLMFAHDHCFEHILPLQNCPDYTLYRLQNCRTFSDWVETVANQWLDNIQK
ncbi:hypothetical protein [Paenibacillus alkalitolerans]|uniref:hypothetical protein n=1 Tax=Paenibacillus alkalitolerans TaxID=2799335 RepID=UPI0018F2B5E1|nr:hypothetical protein [Paenibacillus alkalitolerans]